MKKMFGAVLIGIGVIAGIGGFLLELYYAYLLWGILGTIIALVIFPVALAALPFCALFMLGDLTPLVLSVVSIIGFCGGSFFLAEND